MAVGALVGLEDRVTRKLLRLRQQTFAGITAADVTGAPPTHFVREARIAGTVLVARGVVVAARGVLGGCRCDRTAAQCFAE